MITEIFAHISLFRGIGDIEIEKIMNSCTRKKYQKGECVAREGEDCLAFGIIAQGELIVSKENARGESQILAKLIAGKIFGEMLVYSSIRKWPATVWATENSIVYFMDLNRMIQVQVEFPDSYRTLLQNFIGEISDKALHLNKKIEYLSLKNMRGRLAKYLLEQVEKQGKMAKDYLEIPLNRNQLADFLSVSRTSMSRELTKMKEEGLIDFYKNQFRILNLEQLRLSLC